MRALLALAVVALLSSCTLARGAIGGTAPTDAAPSDDAGRFDASPVPLDGAPTPDAFTPDAAVPVDAWSDTGPPPCVPATEACNLFDDDCDGATDENTCGCERRERDGRVYQLCPSATGYEAWGRCTTLGPGYDLAVIDDAAERDWVQAWTGAEWVFIGLQDSVLEGTWVWSDGHTDDLAYWGSSEPNGGTNENCVVTSGGKWIDFTCDGSQRYLCEGSARVWPAPAGTTEACDGRDEDLDGAVDEGACACETFVFDHHVYQRCTTTRTWAEAQAACATGGYAMAVVDTRTESVRLARALPGGSWTGLNDQASEDHFVWESDPSVPISTGNRAEGGHFVGWSGGEPNDSGGTHAENCVWVDGGGGWYDIDCERSSGYACERAIVP